MAENRRLTRIGLLSAAKTGGIISGLSGFIAGIVFGAWFSFFVALIGSSLGNDFSKAGFAVLIILPILFAVVFSIAGCFIAAFIGLLYNLTAAFSGGLKISIEEEETTGNKTITELPDEKYRKNAFRSKPDRRFACRRREGGAL